MQNTVNVAEQTQGSPAFTPAEANGVARILAVDAGAPDGDAAAQQKQDSEALVTETQATALELAEKVWGAQRAWLFTESGAEGHLIAALALRYHGERVLVKRSEHSSTEKGLPLSGLVPEFDTPKLEGPSLHVHAFSPGQLDAELTEAAASSHPVSSVYLVSPSPSGATSDIAKLAAVAHSHNAALVVDASCAAHFGFHTELPESPLKLGADLVIVRGHALTAALQHSSILFLGQGTHAKRLEKHIARASQLLGAALPSAAHEEALATVCQEYVAGAERIGEAVRISDALRDWVRRDDRFHVISDEYDSRVEIVAIDPLRIPIDVSPLGCSGHWVRERLLADHDVEVEMSTATTIVLTIGLFEHPDLCRIVQGLDAVATQAEQTS